MFLNKLDTQSKEAFLELSYFVAKSDESFSDIQKSLIEGYAKEMDIENIQFDEKKFSLEDNLKRVINKDYQKIILMEILAIVYTDSLMHPEEKKIIDVMVDVWNINSSLVIVYGEWAKNLLSLYIQGDALLDLN
jgi:uncharacterized tellurite resistance protein B-like protein